MWNVRNLLQKTSVKDFSLISLHICKIPAVLVFPSFIYLTTKDEYRNVTLQILELC